MRKNNNTKKFRIITLGISLLLIAGVGGYAVSGFIDTPKQATPTANKGEDTPPQNPAPDLLACVAALPTETKLAQKLLFAVYNDQAAELTPILSELGVGGVIIMDETSAEQITQLKDGFAIAPFIAVDQEGGTVQRYTDEGVLSGASDMVNVSPEEAYNAYLKDNQYLASLGITTNFAPVVDVISKQPVPLPGRMYSSDINTVATYAGQAVKAMQDAKIQPVIKHFPGMGSANGNTDFGSATTDPFPTLQTRDILPYLKLAEQKPDVMVGNMIVPGLTGDQPASLSAEAITLLRSLGYEKSVVYTDSLTAKAIPGTLQEATLKAWSAGVDMAVIVQTGQDIDQIKSDVSAIISLANVQIASGTLSDSELNLSNERIFARKNIDPCKVAKQ